MGRTDDDDCTRDALLMAKLNHQRTQAQFCDCVIRKGQGQVYPVHRCILAASSPVLASTLYSSGVLVELEAPCLSDCILGHLLDYIYTGILPHLDYKLYLHLLAAAQYLEMDELQHTIRTKAAETLECYNTTDEATRFALLPRIDCYKSPSESSLHCSSESKNKQRYTLETHLSLDAKNKYIHWSDSVYMKSIPGNHNCGIFETDQKSLCTGSSGEKQQLSSVCQDKQKNESAGGIKEEEARSHPSVSTEVQENEQTQLESTQNLWKHDKVKAEEMQSNSGEDKNHNSSCCSTSVIRHSSRVTRVEEENVAIKLPHDTEPCTGQTPRERTYRAIAEDMKAPNHHFDNQDLESTPAYQYSICSVNLSQNNELLDTTSPVDNVSVALADEISDTGIQICEKRKLKEKNSDKCCKSAKTCSASVENEINIDVFYNNEQDASLENTNTPPTIQLCRSLSVPSEGNACQPACTDASYNGQLFYRCESSRTSHIPFAPTFSPTFSDTSSEDNDVSKCSTLIQTETLDEGEVILLDISSKSPEMLVSYKCTSAKGTHAADTIDEIKVDHDKSQNSEGKYQGGNDRHEGEVNILTTSLTSCTSVCAHNPTVSPVHHAFRCSLCERSFSQRGSLNRHVRSHLGVRPFPCPQCPMSFSRQYRVVEHMRVHQRSVLGTDFPKPPASSV